MESTKSFISAIKTLLPKINFTFLKQKASNGSSDIQFALKIVEEYNKALRNGETIKTPYIGTLKDEFKGFKEGNPDKVISGSKIYPNGTRDIFFQGLKYKYDPDQTTLFDRNFFLSKNQTALKQGVEQRIRSFINTTEISVDEVLDFMKQYYDIDDLDQGVVEKIHKKIRKQSKEEIIKKIITNEGDRFIEELTEIVDVFNNGYNVDPLRFDGLMSSQEQFEDVEENNELSWRINFVVGVINCFIYTFSRLVQYNYSKDFITETITNYYSKKLITEYNKQSNKKIVIQNSKTSSINLSELINQLDLKEQEQRYYLFGTNQNTSKDIIRNYKSLLYRVTTGKDIDLTKEQGLNDEQKILIQKLSLKYQPQSYELKQEGNIEKINKNKEQVNIIESKENELQKTMDIIGDISYDSFKQRASETSIIIGSGVEKDYCDLFTKTSKERVDIINDFCLNMTRSHLGLPALINPKKYAEDFYVYRSKKHKQGLRFHIKKINNQRTLSRILDHDGHEKELKNILK